VPSAEGVSHKFMKGVSHEFMRHNISHTQKLLDPTLEGQDFKKTCQGQEEGEGLQYFSKGIGPEGSRQSPKARYILTRYIEGRFASQEFDNLQDYDDCNPCLSQPYAFDSDGTVERTPHEIQQFWEARDRKYGKIGDIERLTFAILSKGPGSDSIDYSRKQRLDSVEDQRQTRSKSFEN
jgi:hypothetical protein